MTEPLPVLWLCGPSGAGKSVTAWQLFQDLAPTQVGYVDIDQLKMLYPEAPGDPDRVRLGAQCLAEVARVHSSMGSRALIVSGVLEPDSVDLHRRILEGMAKVTWCLMTADESELRARLAARGWDDAALERCVDEARAWEQVDELSAQLDSSAMTVTEAARRARQLLRLRAPSISDSGSHVDAGLSDGSPATVIHGPRGVGCSTVAWALFQRLLATDVRTGFLDRAQLGFVHAPGKTREDLVLRAVSSLARVFSAHGAHGVLLNGTLPVSSLRLLHARGAHLVRLEARRESIAERIAERRGGDSGARLVGEDLEGADDSYARRVLDQALDQQRMYRSSGLSAHVVATDDRTPAELAEEILARGGLATW